MAEGKSRLRSLLKEPLLQFAALGLILLFVYGVLGAGGRDEGRIVVTQTDVDRLRTLWMQQWRRLPTAEELKGLVDDFVREEILYREALAMKLDADDPVVRRRLVQKIELLTEDLAGLGAIPEADLVSFFDERRESYRQEALLSFSHVYFNEDQRGRDAARDATRLLARLNREPDLAWEPLGDRFLLQRSYTQRRKTEIDQLFGTGFADDLLTAELGRWTGPWRSGYGLHLVRVDGRTDARLPDLAEVRARVEQDFRAETRRQASEQLYSRLKEGYEVVIDARLPEAAVTSGVGQ